MPNSIGAPIRHRLIPIHWHLVIVVAVDAIVWVSMCPPSKIMGINLLYKQTLTITLHYIEELRM
ncbi:hypothetical protein RDWZM_009175, partial [Blomia tropicalis]